MMKSLEKQFKGRRDIVILCGALLLRYKPSCRDLVEVNGRAWICTFPHDGPALSAALRAEV